MKMKELSTNLYVNFQVSKPKKRKVKCVITGNCGNGKTSLINKICNTKLMCGVQSRSLTRDIAYENVILKNERAGTFVIYDTPGTNSTQRAMQHALVIRRTLTAIDFNMILIQSKFDDRFESDTLPSLKNLSKIFKGYENNLLFLISNIDKLDTIPQGQTKTKAQVISNIGKSLEKYRFKHNFILYSNRNTSGQNLAQVLYSLASQNEPARVKINDEIFYKYFKIEDINIELQEEMISDYLKDIQEIAQPYKDYLPNLTYGNTDNDDIICYLKSSLKFELKQAQMNQYKQYSQTLQMSFSADLFLLISQKIHSILQQFEMRTQPKLTKQYFFERDSKHLDIRDLFKSCPNCDKIWMRAEGCDGETFCGAKPSFFDYFKTKSFWKFDIKRVDGKLYVSKKQLGKKTQEQIKIHKQETKKPSIKQKQTKDEGCGQKLVWRDLPRLHDIDDKLKQVYGISNFAEIKIDHHLMYKEQEERKKQIEQRLAKNDGILKRSQRERW